MSGFLVFIDGPFYSWSAPESQLLKFPPGKVQYITKMRFSNLIQLPLTVLNVITNCFWQVKFS